MHEKTPYAMVENCDFGMVFNTHTHTIFAQQPRWAVHNDQLDYQAPSSAPLPTNLSPNFAQNAAWDENNNLLFYFVDGEIFDKNGNNIWPTQTTISQLAIFNSEFQGHSECIIVPRPDSCENYYVLWTDYDATSGYLGERYLIAVELKVDINNNATVVPPSSSDDFQKFIIHNDHLGNGELEKRLNNHIAITKKEYNGNRFLFVSGYRYLTTFVINSSGVHKKIVNYAGYAPGINRIPLPTSLDPLRSELEIFENDNEIRLISPYTRRITPQGLPEYYVGGFEEIKFSFNNLNNALNCNNPNLTIYAEFNLPYETVQVPKGVEFSHDGQFLYFTINNLTYNPGGSDPTFGDFELSPSGPNLKIFRYDAQNDAYYFVADELDDPQYSDLGLGQMELGIDHKLYIAGDNRIAQFDYNGSYFANFNPNYYNLQNQLTNADNTLISQKAFHQLYLLVDQVDNENYSINYYTDILEKEYVVCSFPYTINFALAPGVTARWYFAPRWTEHITDYEEDGVEFLTAGGTCTFYEPGSLLIEFTNANGCTWTETALIIQDLASLYGAAFTASYFQTTSQNSGTLNCYSQVPSTTLPHVWSLYTLDPNTNQYTPHSTKFTQNPTFTGLDISTDYKITHQFLLPQNYPCLVNNYAEWLFESWHDVLTGESLPY